MLKRAGIGINPHLWTRRELDKNRRRSITFSDEPGRAKSSTSFSSAAILVLVSALRVAARHSTMFEDAIVVQQKVARSRFSHCGQVTKKNWCGPGNLPIWNQPQIRCEIQRRRCGAATRGPGLPLLESHACRGVDEIHPWRIPPGGIFGKFTSEFG